MDNNTKIYEVQITYELPGSKRNADYDELLPEYSEVDKKFFKTREEAEQYVKEAQSITPFRCWGNHNFIVEPLAHKVILNTSIAEMPYDWYSKIMTVEEYEKTMNIDLSTVHKCADCKYWKEEWSKGIHFVNLDMCEWDVLFAKATRISNCSAFKPRTEEDIPYSKECKYHTDGWCNYDESNVAGISCKKDICPILHPELAKKNPPKKVTLEEFLTSDCRGIKND